MGVEAKALARVNGRYKRRDRDDSGSTRRHATSHRSRCRRVCDGRDDEEAPTTVLVIAHGPSSWRQTFPTEINTMAREPSETSGYT